MNKRGSRKQTQKGSVFSSRSGSLYEHDQYKTTPYDTLRRYSFRRRPHRLTEMRKTYRKDELF